MPVFPNTSPVPYHWDFIKIDHKSANAKKERKESKSKSGGLANSFSVFRLESSSPRAREFPEQGSLVDGSIPRFLEESFSTCGSILWHLYYST